jgi:antitoxin (DNA-binding transcriptional repressor) of toxin-antitoxin stability system
MAEVVPMHQAKSTLSQLVQRAAAGETILIGPNGHPQVKLVALDAPAVPARRLGGLKGRIKIPRNFDAPLPDDILAEFEGPA